MRAQRPVTDFVGVDGLVSARADRPHGDAAELEDGGVDDTAQVLGGELRSAPAQPAIATDARRLERVDAGQESCFGGAQRSFDLLHFFAGLDLPFRPEGLPRYPKAEVERLELPRESQREGTRNFGALRPQSLQACGDDVLRARRLRARSGPLRHLRPGPDVGRVRLPLRAIHFEVAHHEDGARSRDQAEERIGGEEPGRIEDVGVVLRCRVKQPDPHQARATSTSTS